MAMFGNKHEQIRFLKFLVVGISGTIIDFGIMNLSSLYFHIPLVWAQAISFIIAVINNFLWNRYWIYPESRSKKARKQFLQFLLINSVSIALRTPLITGLNNFVLKLLDQLNINLPIKNYILSQNLALAAIIVLILFWNFFANRFWTYGDIPIGEKNLEKKGSTIKNPDNKEVE